MTCESVRTKLAEFLYGDLTPLEAAPIQDHLRGCAACRGDEAGLQRVRRLLDAAPAPEVSVSLAAIYRHAADGNQRRVRRWRRAAVVFAGAAAAVVAIVMAPRFEVRVDGRQLVLRWADPSIDIPAPPPPTAQVERPAQRSSPELEEQVEVLSELIQGQREEMAQLQAQLTRLRQRVAADAQRWLSTERDVAAFSNFQNLTPKKGDVHD